MPVTRDGKRIVKQAGSPDNRLPVGRHEFAALNALAQMFVRAKCHQLRDIDRHMLREPARSDYLFADCERLIEIYPIDPTAQDL